MAWNDALEKFGQLNEQTSIDSKEVILKAHARIKAEIWDRYRQYLSDPDFSKPWFYEKSLLSLIEKARQLPPKRFELLEYDYLDMLQSAIDAKLAEQEKTQLQLNDLKREISMSLESKIDLSKLWQTEESLALAERYDIQDSEYWIDLAKSRLSEIQRKLLLDFHGNLDVDWFKRKIDSKEFLLTPETLPFLLKDMTLSDLINYSFVSKEDLFSSWKFDSVILKEPNFIMLYINADWENTESEYFQSILNSMSKSPEYSRYVGLLKTNSRWFDSSNSIDALRIITHLKLEDRLYLLDNKNAFLDYYMEHHDSWSIWESIVTIWLYDVHERKKEYLKNAFLVDKDVDKNFYDFLVDDNEMMMYWEVEIVSTLKYFKKEVSSDVANFNAKKIPSEDIDIWLLSTILEKYIYYTQKTDANLSKIVSQKSKEFDEEHIYISNEVKEKLSWENKINLTQRYFPDLNEFQILNKNKELDSIIQQCMKSWILDIYKFKNRLVDFFWTGGSEEAISLAEEIKNSKDAKKILEILDKRVKEVEKDLSKTIENFVLSWKKVEWFAWIIEACSKKIEGDFTVQKWTDLVCAELKSKWYEISEDDKLKISEILSNRKLTWQVHDTIEAYNNDKKVKDALDRVAAAKTEKEAKAAQETYVMAYASYNQEKAEAKKEVDITWKKQDLSTRNEKNTKENAIWDKELFSIIWGSDRKGLIDSKTHDISSIIPNAKLERTNNGWWIVDLWDNKISCASAKEVRSVISVWKYLNEISLWMIVWNIESILRRIWDRFPEKWLDLDIKNLDWWLNIEVKRVLLEVADRVFLWKNEQGQDIRKLETNFSDIWKMVWQKTLMELAFEKDLCDEQWRLKATNFINAI